MWKCSAITFAALAVSANVVIPHPAYSAANKDAAFVWPKDSRFDCRGSLVREDGILQLAPEKGMLTWCDADISSSDEKRVLSECQLGQACRITGTRSWQLRMGQNHFHSDEIYKRSVSRPYRDRSAS